MAGAMILANAVLVYPVPLMGGLDGLVLAMGVEALVVYGYLRRAHSLRWIAARFVLANLLSTLAGLQIYVAVGFSSRGLTEDRVVDWLLGVIWAFLVTILIERLAFADRKNPATSWLRWRAVLMGNVLSYATLVAVYLWLLSM